MNINWLGHSCFVMAEKISGQEVTVATAPFGKEIGLFPPKIKADIVTINQHHFAYDYIEKISNEQDEPPFIIDRPGEYEVKKLFVLGIDVPQAGKNIVIYKFEFDDISVAHLGGLNTQLSEEQIERLGQVDILFIPVGGGDVLSGAAAAMVVREIEPRLVIPMEFKIPDLTLDLTDEQKFLKEMGGNAEVMPRLKIQRKDLPEDKIKVVVFEPGK